MSASSCPRYYEVLGISKTASFEEIKLNYRRLAKQCHPDKVDINEDRNQRTSEQDTGKFQEIEEAYRILSNESTRRKYDEQEAVAQRSHPIAAHLSLDDMDLVDDPSGMSYPCRCGDFFFVSREKIRCNLVPELIVPCSSCSFAVLVRFDPPI